MYDEASPPARPAAESDGEPSLCLAVASQRRDVHATDWRRLCSAGRFGFAEQAKQIRVPTLVLAGSHDPLVPPVMLRDTILSHIAGARMALLPCGHEIPQEMPEHTAALLEAFLSGTGQSLTTQL